MKTGRGRTSCWGDRTRSCTPDLARHRRELPVYGLRLGLLYSSWAQGHPTATHFAYFNGTGGPWETRQTCLKS